MQVKLLPPPPASIQQDLPSRLAEQRKKTTLQIKLNGTKLLIKIVMRMEIPFFIYFPFWKYQFLTRLMHRYGIALNWTGLASDCVRIAVHSLFWWLLFFNIIPNPRI